MDSERSAGQNAADWGKQGMHGMRRWMVRLLWVAVFGIPMLLVGAYVLNPWGVQSRDPRQRILAHSPFRVGSNSMMPTLARDQIVLVRAGRADALDLHRGQIVTLQVRSYPPGVWAQRIVGMPGETLEIAEGQLRINGQPVAEPYVMPAYARSEYSRNFGPVQIPAGHYFMLGDYRDNSEDSRLRPLTPAEDITGKIIVAF